LKKLMFIKAKIIESGMTLTEVVTELNKRGYGKESLSSFSQKLSNGTLKYSVAVEIADIIGKKIEWKGK